MESNASDPAEESTRERPSSARGALTLMIGTLASRVTGLLRNSILTQFFPAGVSDAFLTAFKVPNLFRELLAEGALTNAFVPVYRGLSPEGRRVASGSLLALLVLVNGVLMLLAFLAAPWLARLLIGDGQIVDVELTTRLIRIVFPFLPAMSLSALAMGILNSEERFFAPAWAPVALNVVTIALMAVFPGQAVALTVAHVAGGAAQLVVQLPALARHGVLPRLTALWHPALAGVLILVVPSAVTTSGRQILNVLSSNLVTSLYTGAQNAFANADLFLSLMLGLFATSPALAYYSRLSAHAAERPAEFPATLTQGLRLIAFLTVPAGLALLVLAEPLIEFAFNWRALFGAPLDAARLLGSIAAAAPLGLAVFPLGLFALLVRTFYIRRQVALPIAIVLATLLLQGTLYLVLVRPLGLAGLSLAAAVASWLQLLVTLLLVARREGLDLRELTGSWLRMWLAGGVSALVTAAALGWLQSLDPVAGWWGSVVQLAVLGPLLISLYAALTLLLGVAEAKALLVRLRSRLRR